MIKKENCLRVLIASGVRGDTRRYRTFHLHEQCRILGWNALLSHITDSGFRRAAEHTDLLVLHRTPWDTNIQYAIDKVHQTGGRVIYDTDDLLFDLDAFQWIDSPDFADPVRARLYRNDMERHQRTMRLCDAIITSTNFLSKQAERYGLPTFVHRNGFSEEMLTASSRVAKTNNMNSKKSILGYASGTPTHNRDFESIGPALRTILEETPYSSLWLIGPIKLDRMWEKYRKKIIHLPHVPWRLLPGYLAHFDINLAPLVIDNPFAQSKSEIKWMEAALVKVPTVASPTDAFISTIQRNRNGFLAATQDEWQTALYGLIMNQDVRHETGKTAYDQVIRDYCPQTRAKEFLKIARQLFPGLETQREISPKKVDLPVKAGRDSQQYAYNEKSPSLLNMALYTLQYRGPSTMISQGWVYFRRLISPIVPYRKIGIRSKKQVGSKHG